METAPRLIESGVRNYMHTVLHKCYDHRIHWYSLILNVGIFLVFVGVVLVVLWRASSAKLTPEEQRRKTMRDQQIILSKIREFQHQKKNQENQLSQLVRRVESAPVVSELSESSAMYPEKHVDLLYSMAMER